jgi:hypothetical protein
MKESYRKGVTSHRFNRRKQILHFRPNDGSNARIDRRSSFESKRFMHLAWPSNGSICGQTMVQVTEPTDDAGFEVVFAHFP